jgi:hypothetical protein
MTRRLPESNLFEALDGAYQLLPTNATSSTQLAVLRPLPNRSAFPGPAPANEPCVGSAWHDSRCFTRSANSSPIQI